MSVFSPTVRSIACSGSPSQATLESALDGAVGVTGNNGLGFNMWGTIVANDGTVCAVAFSGSAYTSQWLGSRAISAQKANTANDFSLGKDGRKGAFALSTANLYSAVQPGGSLYGLQHSNPVDPEIAYQGSAFLFGTRNDPMVGNRVGGVNVFGVGWRSMQVAASNSAASALAAIRPAPITWLPGAFATPSPSTIWGRSEGCLEMQHTPITSFSTSSRTPTEERVSARAASATRPVSILPI